MTFGIVKILSLSALVLYLLNYSIGWLLYFRKIKMTKRTHQVFFAGIIINLIALLFLIPEFTSEFYLTLASFACMIILPFGKKGGVYHIILSTAGILIYITFFIFILLPL